MEHFCAVVRDFRSLPMMKLRDEARVGDDPRIGRENTRDVFPEHGTRRPQGSRQKRGRQVRTASSERRHRAVRRPSDEAGDHRGLSSSEERPERAFRAPCRSFDAGRGAAVLAVGLDNLSGIDERRIPARFGHRRCQERGRHAFASRHEHVARPRLEMTEDTHRNRQILVLTRRRIDEGEELSPARGSGDEVMRDRAMTLQELGGRARGRLRLATGGACRTVEQQIGHAGERGGDDDERTRR